MLPTVMYVLLDTDYCATRLTPNPDCFARRTGMAIEKALDARRHGRHARRAGTRGTRCLGVGCVGGVLTFPRLFAVLAIPLTTCPQGDEALFLHEELTLVHRLRSLPAKDD